MRTEADLIPAIPERVGPYEILLPIAAGGMATVYLARTTTAGGLTREVAVKVTHAHLRTAENFREEMMEEARLASRVRHPNVVGVSDVGDDPHGVYLVMDYVEGDTLSGLIRSAKHRHDLVPVGVGLRILIDALMGLQAAHELTDEQGSSIGLVHRDFSPQNILVGRDGVSRLADFGVAKAATRLGHTRTGLVKGKIRYMSPEQARSLPIDRRSDVWAAGIVAWELFTGRRLYEEMNDTAMLLQLVSQPPPRIRTLRPELPQEIDDVVCQALMMAPEARPATAFELTRNLRAAARGSIAIADAREVADYVEHSFGAVLKKRRERASEIARLRTEAGRLAASDAGRSDGTGSGQRPSVARRAAEAAAAKAGHAGAPPSPAMAPKNESGIRERDALVGDVPSVFDDHETADTQRVARSKDDWAAIKREDSNPDGRLEAPTLLDMAPHEDSSPGLQMPATSPVDGALEGRAAVQSPAALPTPAGPSPATSGVLKAARPQRKRSPIAVGLAMVAIALVLGGGALLLRPSEPPPAAPPLAREEAPGVSLATPPTPTTTTPAEPPSAGTMALPTEPTATPTGAPTGEADPTTPGVVDRTLEIVANAPVIQLQIGPRTVPVDSAFTKLDVLLTEAERAETVRVVATAIDGRRTAVRVGPDATSVSLKFPRFPSTTKKPASGTLAPSPYER